MPTPIFAIWNWNLCKHPNDLQYICMHIDRLPNFFSIISGLYIKAHVLYNSCSIDIMQTDRQIVLYRC